MITFMSPECLSKLSPADPSHSIIKELIDRSVQESKLSKHHWIPEQDGFFILVQPEDLDMTLDELHPGETLRTIPYEGVHYKDGHYIAVSLLNNQAGLIWVIPDELLGDELRSVLEDNLVPSTETSTNQP
jgi:hypothetical protein